jgi:hypothetical protein
MIESDGVILFRGGEGLNSSRNFDFLVTATLFLRASEPGVASNGSVAAIDCTIVRLDGSYRDAARGVSSLSGELELPPLARGELSGVLLKLSRSVPIQPKLVSDATKSSGGL